MTCLKGHWLNPVGASWPYSSVVVGWLFEAPPPLPWLDFTYVWCLSFIDRSCWAWIVAVLFTSFCISVQQGVIRSHVGFHVWWFKFNLTNLKSTPSPLCHIQNTQTMSILEMVHEHLWLYFGTWLRQVFCDRFTCISRNRNKSMGFLMSSTQQLAQECTQAKSNIYHQSPVKFDL